MTFEGQTVLVTGAQQGIGRAVAIAFAEAGADVAINWLDDRAAAEAVAGAVRQHGRRAALIQADVGKVQECATVVERTVAELGRLDVLVNNAGVFPRVTAQRVRLNILSSVGDASIREFQVFNAGPLPSN